MRIPVSTKNIDIKFKHNAELLSEIIANDVVYMINTEKKGNNSTKACSRVYLNGKIIFSKDTDFSHLMGEDDYQNKLNIFMTQHHKSVLAQFNDMLKKSQKKKSEYLSEALCLSSHGKNKEAFQLLKDGVMVYPDEPILLSYYGFLYSQV